MPRFQARVLAANGQLTQEIVDAVDAGAAARLLTERGLTVLDTRAAGWTFALWRSRTRFDLALFCHELLALLRAGLSLTEALDGLAEREHELGQSDIVQTVLRRLREGVRFSGALAEQGEHFPDLLVAGISASEETGTLPDALARYLKYHAQADRLKQTLISAALYPALLLIVGLGVALFLLAYLVPRFSQIYAGIHADLPWGSRLLMDWGALVAAHPLATSLGLFSVLAGAVWIGRLPTTRNYLQQRLWRMRGLGARLRLMQLARFYRALGLLLNGGISLALAMERARPLLTPPLQVALADATRQVREGQRFSQALEMQQLTTPIARRMLQVGERNGNLGGMLEQIADFHEEEVARWIERFARLFEPLLMLVIGALIGGIVVLLYLPIFELAGSLQ